MQRAGAGSTAPQGHHRNYRRDNPIERASILGSSAGFCQLTPPSGGDSFQSWTIRSRSPSECHQS
jgi:hypothetical protein